MKTKFTKPVIPQLTCPLNKKEVFHWDTVLPNFGIRAYPSGHRLWIVRYREVTGRQRTPSFGDVRTVDLDDARDAARTLLSKVKLGADPQAEKKAARKAMRVLALVDAYLAGAEARLKPNTFVEVNRHLRIHAKPLHQDAAALVERADVVKVLNRIMRDGKPVAANRVRSTLSAMWAWGLTTGLINGENPVANVPKPGVEASRERVLTDTELALIWQATAGAHDHDRIVRLLLLTGARRGEVAGMARTEIEGSLWTLPRTRSKNGVAHEVPLGPLALAQMPDRRKQGKPGSEIDRALVFGDGKGGFSGWSRCKERLDERLRQLRCEVFQKAHGRAPDDHELLPMDWTLHDLRRTLSTWLSEHGTEPHVVEAVLNHVSGAAKRGVAGVYNKAQYREPKRAALARWDVHVRETVGLAPLNTGNVVALAKAG